MVICLEIKHTLSISVGGSVAVVERARNLHYMNIAKYHQNATCYPAQTCCACRLSQRKSEYSSLIPGNVTSFLPAPVTQNIPFNIKVKTLASHSAFFYCSVI